jgi:hypothetical protein
VGLGESHGRANIDSNSGGVPQFLVARSSGWILSLPACHCSLEVFCSLRSESGGFGEQQAGPMQLLDSLRDEMVFVRDGASCIHRICNYDEQCK